VDTVNPPTSRELLYNQLEQQMHQRESCAVERNRRDTDRKGAFAKVPIADNALTAVSKPSNPKDAVGSGKLPLHLFPLTAVIYGCIALLNGALKYGRSNFRAVGVRSSIYYDATLRHLGAWMEGEECDPDDGVHHLGAALACIAVLIDAKEAGKLNDDRNVQGGYRACVERMTTEVARLKAQHADKAPRHYTIHDNEAL
jgi:hypothetical protein